MKCEAQRWLTAEDWELIEFYSCVSDQWFNQTPMGGAKGQPPVLTPRLEGYEAALRIYGYDRALWPWLVRGASMLHGLVHGSDKVNWLRETGKQVYEVEPEDVADGE